jgi:hypothetical protein
MGDCTEASRDTVICAARGLKLAANRNTLEIVTDFIVAHAFTMLW